MLSQFESRIFLIVLNQSTETVSMVVIQLERGVGRVLPMDIFDVDWDYRNVSKFRKLPLFSNENTSKTRLEQFQCRNEFYDPCYVDVQSLCIL